MFYPTNLLVRGGRLHMVWMAEYCPAKLREIRRIQMERVDFVQLCEYICQVIKNESGSSKSRFSLRLSSKLMRGLVRLYERKMVMFVGDLFVMHSAMLKVMYHKATVSTVTPRRPKRQRRQFVEEQPSDEEDLEERLLNSVVLAQNNEITLRECEFPEIQLPVNDFGDEGPAAIADLLGEQSVEQMMAPEVSALVTSAREFATSPHTPRVPGPALAGLDDMEILPEFNVTLFDKATADGEIPVVMQEEIPRISEVLPQIPGPAEEEVRYQKECLQPQEDENEFELEALTDADRHTRSRHRRMAKLIDREDNLIIPKDIMKARVQLIKVETVKEDIIDFKRVPADLLLRRPAWSGSGHKCCVSKSLYELFDRNLVTHKPLTPVREKSQERRRTTVGERPSLVTEQKPMEVIEQQPMEVIEQQQQLEVIEQQPMEIEQPEQPMPANISELPTILSVAEKTATDIDYVPPAKIPRLDVTVDAGNLYVGRTGTDRRKSRLRTALRSSGALQDPQRPTARGSSSGGTETPLGSVDRTPVCLNSSDPVTESTQMLKDRWGVEGTIINYYEIARERPGQHIDVRALFEHGPKVPGKSNAVTVAKIFYSLLKLQQHQCLKLEKDNLTHEIVNIKFGPRLAECDIYHG